MVEQLSIEQRRQHLGRVVNLLIGQGARVEAAADDHVLIAFGGKGMKPWMHLVHAVLTLGTVGMWSAIWVIHWVRSRSWRRIVTIDEFGGLSGSVWKAGSHGALPVIGPVVSGEGSAVIQAGQRTVSFNPGLSTKAFTRIAPILLLDGRASLRITLVNNQWKIGTISISINAPAPEAVRVYWFALS